MERYEWVQTIILLIGSLIVIYIGAGLLKTKTEEMGQSLSASSVPKTIYSACVVTWFNPQAILDGTMMLGAFHASLPPAQSLPFISGAASASCLWFVGLTLFISLFRRRFNPKILQKINFICGAIIIFYGCRLFFSFLSMIMKGFCSPAGG